MSYLQDAMQHLGVWYTPQNVLSLGFGDGKTGLDFVVGNPPFVFAREDDYMNKALSDLGAELDRESATWLEQANPLLWDALEVAVINGQLPEDIRAFVIRRVGPDRTALAIRCEAAARFLLSQKAK